MEIDEFLFRQKLTNKVNSASIEKTDDIHSITGATQATIQNTADTVKADFVISGLRYISYLLDEVLRQYGHTMDILKGLAALDPFIFLKRPTEVALRHLRRLLRSWVTSADEPAYRY